MAKGRCIECDDSFRGRSDKKFCSDNCRSQYNNRRYKRSEAVIKINYILKRNHRILKKVTNSLSQETLPLEYLLMEGFIPDYFTHIQRKENNDIRYCYNYGIAFQEDGHVQLHKI